MFFFSKTFNSIIIKKPKPIQNSFDFQSSFSFDHRVDKKNFFKLTENIQIKVESYCSSLAFLSFVNEKHEPIKIPEHITFKKLKPEEIIQPEELDDMETLMLMRDCSYKMFWKQKVIFTIGPDPYRQEFFLTEEFDKIE
jgi:hypothetical protein